MKKKHKDLQQEILKDKDFIDEIKNEDEENFNQDNYSRAFNPYEISIEDKWKISLCNFIIRFKNDVGISNKKLAELVDVKEPTISRIINYRIEHFTIDKLLSYASDIARKNNKEHKELWEQLEEVTRILNKVV